MSVSLKHKDPWKPFGSGSQLWATLLCGPSSFSGHASQTSPANILGAELGKVSMCKVHQNILFIDTCGDYKSRIYFTQLIRRMLT